MRKLFTIILFLLFFSNAEAASYKGFIGGGDLNLWDGVTRTFERQTSTGGVLELNKIYSVVDVLEVYGDGTDYSDTAINAALARIGTTTKVGLLLQPGTWTISANTDWSSYTNVTFFIPPGAVISYGAHSLYLPRLATGNYQILSGTGIVKILPSVETIYPEWFGENTTPGTTDMDVETQSCVNTSSWNYQTCKLGPQTYLVSKTYFYYSAANNPNYNTAATKQGYINFIGSGAASITGSGASVQFRDSKTIIKSTSAVDAILDLQEVSSNHLMNYTLKDFSILATGVTEAVILADSLAKNSVIENVTIITSSGDGVQIDDIYLGAVKNVEVAYDAAAPVAGTKGFNFYNSLRDGQVFIFEKLRAQTFETGIYIEGNGTTDGQFTLTASHTKDCTYPLHIKSMMGVTIQGNKFGEVDVADTNEATNAIWLEDVRAVSIMNNRNRAKGDIILLDGVLDFFIGPNYSERPTTVTAGSGGVTAVLGSTVARGTVLNHTTGGGTGCYGFKMNSARAGVSLIYNYITADYDIDDESYVDLYIAYAGGLVTQKIVRQTFTANDATPDVSGGTIFKTNNGVATTITDFDGGPVDGKRIIVYIRDANTTVDFTSTNLKGNAGADWSPGNGDFMECTYDSVATFWYCSVHDTTA